jgi:hypothetical protein
VIEVPVCQPPEARPPLRTFKLTPTIIRSALWSLSTCNDEIYVRAAGPMEARHLASAEFSNYRPRTSNGRDPSSPWLDSDLVDCVEIKDEHLEAIKAPAVLFASAPIR